VLCAGIVIFCASTFAELLLSPVHAEDEVESPHAAVVNWDFAEWCQVGKHRFTFEKTTLGNVIQALGGGKMNRDGDAGAAVYQWFVSYRWNNKIVTFSSNNDMGGSTHDLEEVDIKPVANGFDASKLPVIQGHILFPIGEPGMSFQALQHLLGPSPLVNSYAEYQYPGHIQGKDYDGKPIQGDVSGWLRVKVVRDKVDRIEISRITSY
jgi:hypothetical protein